MMIGRTIIQIICKYYQWQIINEREQSSQKFGVVVFVVVSALVGKRVMSDEQ
jgi:hypothetical protein